MRTIAVCTASAIRTICVLVSLLGTFGADGRPIASRFSVAKLLAVVAPEWAGDVQLDWDFHVRSFHQLWCDWQGKGENECISLFNFSTSFDR